MKQVMKRLSEVKTFRNRKKERRYHFKSWIKPILFGLASAGFLWQALEFYDIYCKYPTVAQSDILVPSTVALPAITFCNANGVKRSLWCGNMPELCQIRSHESPKDYENRLQDVFDSLNKSQRVYYGEQLRDFVIKCRFGKEDCIRNFTETYDYTYGNCFTLFARWGTNNIGNPLTKAWNPNTGKTTKALKIYLNVQADEYVKEMRSKTRVKVVLHAKCCLPIIDRDGLHLQPGFTHYFAISKTITKYLKTPYKNNCKNYTDLVERRYNASLTQESCLEECYWSRQHELCGCVQPRLSHTLGGPTCSKKEIKNCLDSDLKGMRKTCDDKCRISCIKTSYDIDIMDSNPWPLHLWDVSDYENISFTNTTHARQNLLKLQIYYRRMEQIETSIQPKYQHVEAFSLMGGYIGLWLGVSVYTLGAHIATWTEQLLHTLNRFNRFNINHVN